MPKFSMRATEPTSRNHIWRKKGHYQGKYYGYSANSEERVNGNTK